MRFLLEFVSRSARSACYATSDAPSDFSGGFVVTADEYDKVAAERDRLRAACEASLAMIQDIKMVSWKAASIRTGSPAIIAERLIRAALALGTTDPAK
jgi:hypothetical protein